MVEAYRLTRKDGAPGIDGMTAADYEAEPGGKSSSTSWSASSPAATGTAGAPALHPEGGRHATASRHPDLRRQGGAAGDPRSCWRPIYETDFCPCSYGFRPGRSAHDALRDLRNGFMDVSRGCAGWWTSTYAKYFDTIAARASAGVPRPASHGRRHPTDDRQVAEGGRRSKTGVLRRTTEGTPQGGVISPLPREHLSCTTCWIDGSRARSSRA